MAGWLARFLKAQDPIRHVARDRSFPVIFHCVKMFLKNFSKYERSQAFQILTHNKIFYYDSVAFNSEMDAFSGDVTDDVLPTTLTPNTGLLFLISFLQL